MRAGHTALCELRAYVKEIPMQEDQRGDISVLATLFEHNTWANLKLLDFCEQLSGDQLDATAIGCFASIRDTLTHIIGAEVSYVHRVNGKLLGKPFCSGPVSGHRYPEG